MATETTSSYLATVRARVDAALDGVLPAVVPGAPPLAEAMRYSIFAGGKRLRPALALAACHALGADSERALPFACALEMVHTYSLIHDDLPAMDDDDLRRGRPTSHKVFGVAMAILAGDALHTQAFQVIADSDADADTRATLLSLLAAAAGFGGMVGGQAEDLAEGDAPATAERLARIHRQKTAALIRAAVCGGAVAGGGSEAQVRALGAFGEALGLAFQITDDVLDETGSAADLGKTPGKDKAAGKLTYVTLEGLEGAKRRANDARAKALEALAAIDGLSDTAILRDLATFVTDRSR